MTGVHLVTVWQKRSSLYYCPVSLHCKHLVMWKCDHDIRLRLHCEGAMSCIRSNNDMDWNWGQYVKHTGTWGGLLTRAWIRKFCVLPMWIHRTFHLCEYIGIDASELLHAARGHDRRLLGAVHCTFLAQRWSLCHSVYIISVSTGFTVTKVVCGGSSMTTEYAVAG
jgi:hypothetical protein